MKTPSSPELPEATEPRPTPAPTPAKPRDKRLRDDRLGASDPDNPQICRGID